MRLLSRLMCCFISALPVLVVFPGQAYAQASIDQIAGEGDGAENSAENSAKESVEVESEYIFINMLEFLAEFETADGDWISPDILANESFTDLGEINDLNDSNGSSEENR